MNLSAKRTDRRGRFDRFGGMAALRIAALVVLFTSAGVIEARQLSSLLLNERDDVWWHLHAGTRILQEQSLPHDAISDSPDPASTGPSWGYDLLVATAFGILDLRSFPALLMVFKLGLAVVTFLLAGGLRGRFWMAVALSAIAQYVLGTVPLGPGYCSILLFGIELIVLNRSRRTGSARPLFWLPVLFLAWANLDVQFVYGMLLFAVFLAASALRNFGSLLTGGPVEQSKSQKKPAPEKWANTPSTVGMLVGLCVIASVVTPFAYHLYGVFLTEVSGAANQYFADALPMRFRASEESLFLLLTMFAFVALGLRRSRDPFQILLLAGCAMASFHARRDAWLAVLAAIAVIAPVEKPEAGAAADLALDRHVLIAAGLSVAILLLAITLRIPRQNELLARVGKTYPVAAGNYLRENQMLMPLLTSYEWGGFLLWYLPDSALAISGRANVLYAEYPGVNQAGTLLVQRNSRMGQALIGQAALRISYSDSLSVVLVKR